MQNEITPNFVTVPEWIARSGISRSRTYELLGTGDLRARKVGRRTLIDLRAGLAWLDAQPAPRISLPYAKRTQAEVL